MKLFCSLGLHPWRAIVTATPPAIGVVVLPLILTSQGECARCGLVRIEGRWGEVRLVRAGSNALPSQDDTDAVRAEIKRLETLRRVWGLSAWEEEG